MQENNRKNSVIKQNILKYLENKGISKYECYQKTGIVNGVLSQIGGISEENLLKFLSYYSDISLDWLFLNKGSMIKSSDCDYDNDVPPIYNQDNFWEIIREKDKQINKLLDIIKSQK